ncbi:MAG: tetratricopeptide repeat protein [Pirellulales bacterium]
MTSLAHAKMLHQSGRLREAEAIYRQLLAADPGNVEVEYLLAAVCDSLGRADEAIARLQGLLARAPNHAETHNHLGALLAERGQLAAAIQHFEIAVRLRPQWTEPRQNLEQARVNELNQRGLAQVAAADLAGAIACYRQALVLRPDDVASRGNLGNALKLQGQFEEAAECFVGLLAQAPQLGAAHYSLGTVRCKQGRHAEAEQHLRRAIELQPQDSQSYCELGRVMLEQNRVDEALSAYRRAVECAPASAAAHFHLAFALLLAGDFAAGWREYEWRLKLPRVRPVSLTEPEWTGSPLAGRTLLVRGEQGFGDALQFVRFAETLERAGATVVVECHRALARLLATCPGVSQTLASGEPPPVIDCHVAMQSLPGLLAVTAESFPAKVPYLSVDEESIERWRSRYVPGDSFRVGIAWQGDPGHVNDCNRSFPLERFAQIARLPGVQLYSLQVSATGREQLPAVVDAWPIVDLAPRLTDFYETAAAMQHLDLVITCDSAPAHLAGALGRPVWVALPFAPDWRWLLNRQDSPWYPSMRLFRQPRHGDWEGTFRQIEAALVELPSARTATCGGSKPP